MVLIFIVRMWMIVFDVGFVFMRLKLWGVVIRSGR